MNQETFAREIGRSTPSLRGYEAGRVPPDDVIEKLKTIATARGRADLAVNLTSDEWKVRRVIWPGETLIGASGSVPKAPTDSRDPRRGDWHTIRDQILDSGQADAVNAVQDVLLVI